MQLRLWPKGTAPSRRLHLVSIAGRSA